MTQEDIELKLEKIKALMDRTTGPEHEQIVQKYNELVQKYSSTELDMYEDITEANGDKYMAFKTTVLKAEEIKFYYNYYYPILDDEVHSFIAAFALKNNLVPDESYHSDPNYEYRYMDRDKVYRMMDDIDRYKKPKM